MLIGIKSFFDAIEKEIAFVEIKFVNEHDFQNFNKQKKHSAVTTSNVIYHHFLKSTTLASPDRLTT